MYLGLPYFLGILAIMEKALKEMSNNTLQSLYVKKWKRRLGVNFINILFAPFSYESVFEAFL